MRARHSPTKPSLATTRRRQFGRGRAWQHRRRRRQRRRRPLRRVWVKTLGPGVQLLPTLRHARWEITLAARGRLLHPHPRRLLRCSLRRHHRGGKLRLVARAGAARRALVCRCRRRWLAGARHLLHAPSCARGGSGCCCGSTATVWRLLQGWQHHPRSRARLRLSGRVLRPRAGLQRPLLHRARLVAHYPSARRRRA